MLHDPRTIKVRTGIGGLKCDVSGHLWKADDWKQHHHNCYWVSFISLAREKSIRLLNLRCLIMEFEYIQFVYWSDNARGIQVGAESSSQSQLATYPLFHSSRHAFEACFWIFSSGSCKINHLSLQID